MRQVLRDRALPVVLDKPRAVVDGVAHLAEMTADGGGLPPVKREDFDRGEIKVSNWRRAPSRVRVHDERDAAQSVVLTSELRRSADGYVVTHAMVRMASAAADVEGDENVRTDVTQDLQERVARSMTTTGEASVGPVVRTDAAVEETPFRAQENHVARAERGASGAQLLVPHGAEWRVFSELCANERVARTPAFTERCCDHDCVRASGGEPSDGPASEDALVVGMGVEEYDNVAGARVDKRVPRHSRDCHAVPATPQGVDAPRATVNAAFE